MRRIIRMLRALLLLLLPTALVRPLVNRMGYRIARSARIGFSLVDVAGLDMAEGANIGHFNVIRGGFRFYLATNAAIGHINLITRNVVEGPDGAELRLGTWSKITGIHRVDLTNSVTLGEYSTVAGQGCQLLTHGYVHEMEGLARYRIEGPITIGDNVYVGAGSILSMGVTLGNGVILGAGSTVAKSLIEPGLYVSMPLRRLPRPGAPGERADLEHIPAHPSGDIVYRKRKQ
jgi:acetyltransferase-like isoleucine patch superfamily enzyme